MPTLPADFLDRMKNLPGFDFAAFLTSYEKPAFRGLRVNTLKCPTEHFETVSPFPLKKALFAENGYYIGSEVTGKHPWHHAGVFYLQEPSAMSAVTALDVSPGMKVLDLCAAPGGKSTQAAAMLQGSGLLVCNEIVSSRASILLSNIERCGVRNAIVTSEPPSKLCSRFVSYFDRVLVDAPCSGEGMFRRDPDAANEWSLASTEACAKRQLSILEDACTAVAPGGILVYSTCTFAPIENEGVVSKFLTLHPEFEIETIPVSFGRDASPEWADAEPALQSARRVFPMDGGEGHFVASLRKNCDSMPSASESNLKPASKENIQKFKEFYSSQFWDKPWGRLFQIGEKLYLMPEQLPNLRGLNVLRAGVLAGFFKGSRFEPAHALYLAADAQKAVNTVNLSLNNTELAAFLHGETVEAPANSTKGWVSVKADGFIVGFGKISEGMVKNHYPKGLRNLNL